VRGYKLLSDDRRVVDTASRRWMRVLHPIRMDVTTSTSVRSRTRVPDRVSGTRRLRPLVERDPAVLPVDRRR